MSAVGESDQYIEGLGIRDPDVFRKLWFIQNAPTLWCTGLRQPAGEHAADKALWLAYANAPGWKRGRLITQSSRL